MPAGARPLLGQRRAPAPGPPPDPTTIRTGGRCARSALRRLDAALPKNDPAAVAGRELEIALGQLADDRQSLVYACDHVAAGLARLKERAEKGWAVNDRMPTDNRVNEACMEVRAAEQRCARAVKMAVACKLLDGEANDYTF